MGYGAEDDKDMPDSVEIGFFLIIGKEIGANGIENALQHNHPESKMAEVNPHPVEDDERHPAHSQVEDQAERGVFAQRHDLTHDTGDSKGPHDGYHRDAQCPTKDGAKG